MQIARLQDVGGIEEARVPGVVVPLFRGRQGSEQPLVAVGRSDRWKKPDVARELNVSERTVERWQARQGLPCEKPFGPKGPVRYNPAQVRAWWAARCANGGLS